MATSPSVLDRTIPNLGKGGPPRPPADDGGRGGDGDERPDRQRHVAVLGMWVALAPILMLFLAFVSAYIVRQGLGNDWTSVPVPRMLWFNTLALLISSALLERGRAVMDAGAGGRGWFLWTLAFGVVFVVGQVAVWQGLASRGLNIGATPYSSFFDPLTGTHAVHLLGGLLGLGAAAFWPQQGWNGTTRVVVARVAAIYWHFMLVLWVGLFLVLSFWR